MSPREQAPGPRGSPQEPQPPLGAGAALEPFAATAKTLSCGLSIAAEDQGFELVLTFLTDIFKNRHRRAPMWRTAAIRINFREFRKLVRIRRFDYRRE
jgi:hypothetical protein